MFSNVLFYPHWGILTHQVGISSWQNITGYKGGCDITMKLWNNKTIGKYFKIHYKMTIWRVYAPFIIALK